MLWCVVFVYCVVCVMRCAVSGVVVLCYVVAFRLLCCLCLCVCVVCVCCVVVCLVGLIVVFRLCYWWVRCVVVAFRFVVV